MLTKIVLVSISGFLVSTANCLTCNSCDSFQNCALPFPELCPPHTKCYSLTRHHGEEVVAKGCAQSCESLPFSQGTYCTTCNHADFCNDRKVGQGIVLEDQNAHNIGQGVVPHHDYNIGQGVVPNSSNKLIFVTILIPLISVNFLKF